jgi:hypothetical protein
MEDSSTFFTSLLNPTNGAAANEISLRPPTDQELAANFAGISIGVAIPTRADNAQPSIGGGAVPRNLFGIQTIRISGGTGSLTETATSLAIRATLSEGCDHAHKSN